MPFPTAVFVYGRRGASCAADHQNKPLLPKWNNTGNELLLLWTVWHRKGCYRCRIYVYLARCRIYVYFAGCHIIELRHSHGPKQMSRSAASKLFTRYSSTVRSRAVLGGWDSSASCGSSAGDVNIARCGSEPLTVAYCPVKCLVSPEAPHDNKGSYSGLRRPGPDACHSCLSSAEVKKAF